METNEREKLIQAYLESYNQMDVAAMMGVLEDIVFLKTTQARKKHIKSAVNLLSNLRPKRLFPIFRRESKFLYPMNTGKMRPK